MNRNTAALPAAVSPTNADLIIVDEFSMVDMWLAQQFFKRIGQHTRVVLVGDPNQLPSVGAGNVFYELINSGMVPVTVLDWIFRQSKDGLIAYNGLCGLCTKSGSFQ